MQKDRERRQIGYIRLHPEGKTDIPVITHRGGMMSKVLALVFATLGMALLCSAPAASAQVSVSIGVAPVCPPMGTSPTLHTIARLTVTTGPTGLLAVSLLGLAAGSTARNTFPAMSITGLTLITVTEDRCLGAEMIPTTISTAMRRETGEAT